MVSTGVYILLAVLIVIALGLGIFLIYNVFRNKDDELRKPIFLNFMSYKTNSRFLGRVQKVEVGRNGRTKVEFIPKDIVITDENKDTLIVNEKVILGKTKREVIPKGVLSADYDVVLGLAAHPDDYAEELKNTAFGKALMWATELKNLEELEISILREGGERKDKLLKSIGDGEISKEFMERMEEGVKDYLKAVVNAKEDKGKMNLNPGALGHGSE